MHIIPGLMNRKDLDEIEDYVMDGGLGEDSSSQYFLHREKSIRYIMTLGDGDNYVSLTQDYFVQSEQYNDFSGGSRRR